LVRVGECVLFDKRGQESHRLTKEKPSMRRGASTNSAAASFGRAEREVRDNMGKEVDRDKGWIANASYLGGEKQ
jgi:hypothetical protein